ncbi:MAG: DNA-directed RNA polymerase subunit omega [Bacteroidetes bacterium]|nr:MAG: DNA-directed RNA polymerase subunit omega [Bacteroidota bacterium]
MESTDIKTKAQGLDPNVRARNVQELVDKASSVYEALVVISKRAEQLAVELKHELQQKLDEFAVNTETIEEVVENKEQIEISKFYEKLPNPVIIATEEFINGELHYYYKERKKPRTEPN